MTSGDTATQRAAILERAHDLREQAHRVIAPSDAVAAATEDDIRDYLREQPPQARRDLLQLSPYARLIAQVETLPVIEQAKGIVMAQWHCGADEAFDMLREASQRCNVPIRELAARPSPRQRSLPRTGKQLPAELASPAVMPLGAANAKRDSAIADAA